jgi:hypothetical protein
MLRSIDLLVTICYEYHCFYEYTLTIPMVAIEGK